MVNIPIRPTGQSFEIPKNAKLAVILKAGQIIEAKVLNATHDSLATLLVKGKQIQVKTDLYFKKGETLLLSVAKGAGKGASLRLNLVESANTAKPHAIKQEFAELIKSSGAARIVQSEVTAFKSLVLELDTALLDKIPALKAIKSFLIPISKVQVGGGAHLKEALKSSGLFLEANLKEVISKAAQSTLSAQGAKKEMVASLLKEIGGDFKGALLKLQAALKEVEVIEILKLSSIKPEELAMKVDKLIKNIEFFQLQSKLNDTLELFIPFFWKSLRDGELIFSETYKGASEGKSYSCTINLDLESSGRVSVIVLLMYDSVHLSFIAEKKEFIALINDNSPELKAKFKDLGITLGSVRASREEKLEFMRPAEHCVEEGFNVKA